jgi:hypothetical protein
MICSGMHSNVMLCFMVQAFQDPPLCSSTLVCTSAICTKYQPMNSNLSVRFLITYKSGGNLNLLLAIFARFWVPSKFVSFQDKAYYFMLCWTLVDYGDCDRTRKKSDKNTKNWEAWIRSYKRFILKQRLEKVLRRCWAAYNSACCIYTSYTDDFSALLIE